MTGTAAAAAAAAAALEVGRVRALLERARANMTALAHLESLLRGLGGGSQAGRDSTGKDSTGSQGMQANCWREGGEGS